jgi:hypothetical protein
MVVSCELTALRRASTLRCVPPRPGAPMSREQVLQLQKTAGNVAVVGMMPKAARPSDLVVARTPDAPTTQAPTVTAPAIYPWLGKIDTPYNAALRRSPSKDPANPYANILADLAKGTYVDVLGVHQGWLEVEVEVDGTTLKGYVSHELVRFVRPGRWEIEMDPDPVPKLVLSVTEAFLVLKRAETKLAKDGGYKPDGDEAHQIEVAIKTLEGTKRYTVDHSSFVVSFTRTAGAKIKVQSIEDFVLFAETVERQYPNATVKEVASEIRQVWFAGVNWEAMLASRGISVGGSEIDIEHEPDPIAQMFDMVDLHPKHGEKTLSTRFGTVAISHVMAGIDGVLSGAPPEPRSIRHPKDHKRWSTLHDANKGDPRDFVTWSGDIGQAYGDYIFDRYHDDVSGAKLNTYVADEASPDQLLGDIHGYIAETVWRQTPASLDPAGVTIKVSNIVRTLYMVDKTGTPGAGTYRDFMEKVSGKSGTDLRAFVVERSLAFARLWFAKRVAWVRVEHWMERFDDFHEENERTAAAYDKLGSVVDLFMKMLAGPVT